MKRLPCAMAKRCKQEPNQILRAISLSVVFLQVQWSCFIILFMRVCVLLFFCSSRLFTNRLMIFTIRVLLAHNSIFL